MIQIIFIVRLRGIEGCCGTSQVALAVKNLLANTGRCKRRGFSSGVEKIPWRRAWTPTPVFLSRDSYGKRSLVVSTGLQRVRHNWSHLALWNRNSQGKSLEEVALDSAWVGSKEKSSQTRKKIKRAENSVRGKKENLVQAGKPMSWVMRANIELRWRQLLGPKSQEKSLRLDMTNTVDFDSLSSTKVIFQNK